MFRAVRFTIFMFRVGVSSFFSFFCFVSSCFRRFRSVKTIVFGYGVFSVNSAVFRRALVG